MSQVHISRRRRPLRLGRRELHEQELFLHILHAVQVRRSRDRHLSSICGRRRRRLGPREVDVVCEPGLVLQCLGGQQKVEEEAEKAVTVSEAFISGTVASFIRFLNQHISVVPL